MLRIRLQRVGRKHEPSFRLVLTDSKNSTKSGRFKEILGSYDPRKSSDLLAGKAGSLNIERIKYWLSQGAKPSGTLWNLLVSEKIIEGKKINVLPRKSPLKKEEKGAEIEAKLADKPDGVTAPAAPPTSPNPSHKIWILFLTSPAPATSISCPKTPLWTSEMIWSFSPSFSP